VEKKYGINVRRINNEYNKEILEVGI